MTTVPAGVNFAAFDCQTSDGISVRWAKYVSRYKNMLTAFNIANDGQKLALLLHYGGEDLHDLYDSFPDASKLPTPGADPPESVFVKALTCFADYFSPKQNVEFMKYEFRHTNQQESENLDKFYTRLRTLSVSCDFTDADSEIKSQIISGCKSQKLRRKGLSETTWTLTNLLDNGRAFELSEKHAQDMEKSDSIVSAISHAPKATKSEHQSSSSKCRNCNGTWPHKGGKCPAHGKTCNNCGSGNHFAGSQRCSAMGKTCTNCSKANHFAKMCRAKRSRKPQKKYVKVVNECKSSYSDETDDEYVWNLGNSDTIVKPPVFPVQVNGVKFNLLADSGATINILCIRDFRMLERTDLVPYKKKVYSYNSKTPLTVIGKFSAEVKYKDNCCSTSFIVVNSNNSLLGWQTSKSLGLISEVNNVNSSTTNYADKIKSLKTKYNDIFTGVGKLKDVKVKLHIDNSVKSVAQPFRRTPFHVREQIKQQLQMDEDNDIIESSTGPTPWVSPVVVIPKKTQGKVCVCVDMRAANKAIKRERHNAPTLNELVNLLNGSTVYSKLDLNQAYNQLELDEESRYITTFATHVGLRRYKRLFFGINSAAEVFQEKIRKVLSGLKGAVNISDDILVFGDDDEDHYQNLKACFQRIREKGLTLNPEKCEFNKSSINFYGHNFSAKGLSPDVAKIDSIVNMPDPKNASEVRSLLGMFNYCGQRFIQNYSTLTYELRLLTKKDTPWSWTEKHEAALEKLKASITSTPCLAYFNPKLESHVYVNASPVGISAIIMQIIESES